MTTIQTKNGSWRLAAIFFLIGFSSAALLYARNSGPEEPVLTEQRSGGYKFINPLLECDAAAGSFRELTGIRGSIEDLIASEVVTGAVDQASVYYRDMNNGPWFGIDEDILFTPASMLKVPVMMAAFKLAEKDPAFLSERIRYATGTPAAYQSIRPGRTLEVGKEYTIHELVRQMIVYSDNSVQDILAGHIGGEKIFQVYEDLDLVVPASGEPEDFMSVKNYASIFRILYNSSYLDRPYSELALSILSESEFKSGLAAGLPEKITLANKFGERTFDDIEERQLHDCGIVYHPVRPYLICVMSRGKEVDGLIATIKKISAAVYEQVDGRVE